jgi:molybdopterin molybdotransferase
MTFRGQPFRFASPDAAIAGMIDALGPSCGARQSEACDLIEARGRILARAAFADRDSPPFDYSMMDGYAIRVIDLARAIDAGGQQRTPLSLHVIAEARIGQPPPPMPGASGTPIAIRVSTGAPMPPGADAVVKREDVTEHAPLSPAPSPVTSISIVPAIVAKLKSRDNVRFAGENARAGAEVLCAGQTLSPATIGALGALGIHRPEVFRRLRVAILSTGDELTPADAAPSAFQIRDSNLPALAAAIASRPWLDLTLATRVPDDPGRIVKILRDAAARADAIILTGGVSMGHRDPVLGALHDAFGTALSVIYHGLPQRPGKPMLGAILSRDSRAPMPIFGLPGNPVSALVTATRIGLPVLAHCAGAMVANGPPRVAIATPDAGAIDLWWHRLVRITPEGTAALVDLRGSGDLIACAQSDGFIEVPPDPSVSARAGAGAPEQLAFFPWPA